MKLIHNLKRVQKTLADLEEKTIPNAAKYSINKALSASIKVAAKTLKVNWKVTRSGKEKNAQNFDRRGRYKGAKSAPWLAQIRFFKLREARRKRLDELESNYRFVRPRERPGLVAFTHGTKEPARQKGIKMVAGRFPRRKTKVFIRGRVVTLKRRFLVRINGATQIYRHRGNKLAHQVAPDLDSATTDSQRHDLAKAAKQEIRATFASRFQHLLQRLS